VKPLVVAVMLVNGRPQMVRRAVLSFQTQTYENKRLLIYDTSDDTLTDLQDDVGVSMDDELVTLVESSAVNHHGVRKGVGYLRNRANASAVECGADIIAHWDSDDWSHPRRLEEQVLLLDYMQDAGVSCVGYREVLFWDTRHTAQQPFEYDHGEAWVYSNADPRYVVDATRCYHIDAWRQCPYEDRPHADQRWYLDNSRICAGVAGVPAPPLDGVCYRAGGACPVKGDPITTRPDEARAICEIHGSNTEAYRRQDMLQAPRQWRRAPELDAYCREKMAYAV
jgi:glycosyltransferase involved in cell wall biosynthesis